MFGIGLVATVASRSRGVGLVGDVLFDIVAVDQCSGVGLVGDVSLDIVWISR